MAAEHDWIWYELMTTDPQAAATFYGNVVGWRVERFPGPDEGPQYLVGHAGDRGVVGIMAMPPTVPAGVPPNWTGYIHTASIDPAVKALTEAGGRVLYGPMEIPNVGRLAAVADPEGGVFNLMQPGRTDAPPRPAQGGSGSIGWCELHSDHPEKNFAWYQQLFGWKRGEAMDMGPGGVYQMFSTNDQPTNGGSCGKMGAGQPTHWLYYFAVDGLDAAIERVRQGGGNVFMGPHEVPGGTWIAIGNDPQGAVFALHSQKR
ncbi:VOC family protein [Terriglobus sp.]|uniref:VOC family protein n=1 Tax=Terriglobus sp. TaxID=1889013 RepID=UPI003B00C5AA